MTRRLRVLVADDHEAHRRLLDDLFTALGCTVTTVPDGESAVAAGPRFDIVCLDRHMPGIGGEAAARQLQGTAYLVACTSHPEGIDGAFDAILPKPFCCCELAEIVEAASAARRAGRRQRRKTPCAAAAAVANVACKR